MCEPAQHSTAFIDGECNLGHIQLGPLVMGSEDSPHSDPK